ncbi:hypothetical protein [Methylomonas koyamae]|uniref:hypothetical protein n=1 Tax=Methylomonas koyamae TaxID=702114 RepID=UPI0018D2E4F3|nr:hypothetical protein [Methylomonas koyamae]
MRDIAYEQTPMRHRRKMLLILDDYSQENADSWTERDFLAIQRALQVFIESFSAWRAISSSKNTSYRSANRAKRWTN